MKRITIGVLTAAAASGLALGQASAAHPPRKPPPPPVPPPQAHRWTGFYAGGHLGGGWSANGSATVTDPTGFVGIAPTSFSSSGKGSFIGGAQVGYNWQFASPLVVGVEGDWTGANLSETAGPVPGPIAYTSTLRRNVNSLFSVRGRVGYAADTMLYYFTAGGAWGRTGYSANTFNTIGRAPAYPTAFNNTAQGYVLGGGLEYALNTNWSVRAEYLYYHLGGASQNALGIPTPGNGFLNYSWNAFQANVVRVGVDYQFGQ
jgi:outer membrane immunogenic protein